MTEDNRLYRPSSSDKIALCAHFESTEQETDATRYGHKIHELIAHCLKHPKDQINRLWLAANGADEDTANLVLRACGTAIAEIGDIRGVEDPIHIYDVTEEEITWGTCDVWGYSSKSGVDRLTLLDWKTGEDHGYDRQMAHYGLGLMDREKAADIDIIKIFLKNGKAARKTLSYEQAAEIVTGIYSLVLDKENVPHQINDYCGWCALMGHGCPAWEKEQVIATAPLEAPEILRQSLTDILADPSKRDRFIVAYRAFASLYKELGFEEAAKEDLAKGQVSEHLITYDRKGKSVIDAEQFLQTIVPQMGTMRASTCLTVSVDKAKEAWEKFTKEPFPVPVVPGPTIKVLKEKRNNPPQ